MYKKSSNLASIGYERVFSSAFYNRLLDYCFFFKKKKDQYLFLLALEKMGNLVGFGIMKEHSTFRGHINSHANLAYGLENARTQRSREV